MRICDKTRIEVIYHKLIDIERQLDKLDEKVELLSRKPVPGVNYAEERKQLDRFRGFKNHPWVRDPYL